MAAVTNQLLTSMEIDGIDSDCVSVCVVKVPVVLGVTVLWLQPAHCSKRSPLLLQNKQPQASIIRDIGPAASLHFEKLPWALSAID